LSYTSFEYGKPTIEPSAIRAGQTAKVKVTVRNTGQKPGDEVVQLYIRDEVSSVTRPVKELRDFRRIHLQQGESRTEEFEIGQEKLSFLNRQMKRVVEPGKFQIMVGTSSANLQAVELDVTK
jgi:beta-glucosidase